VQASHTEQVIMVTVSSHGVFGYPPVTQTHAWNLLHHWWR